MVDAAGSTSARSRDDRTQHKNEARAKGERRGASQSVAYFRRRPHSLEGVDMPRRFVYDWDRFAVVLRILHFQRSGAGLIPATGRRCLRHAAPPSRFRSCGCRATPARRARHPAGAEYRQHAGDRACRDDVDAVPHGRLVAPGPPCHRHLEALRPHPDFRARRNRRACRPCCRRPPRSPGRLCKDWVSASAVIAAAKTETMPSL